MSDKFFDPSRRHAPATHRNCEPILAVLRRILPDSLSAARHSTRPAALEVASGTGQHIVAFARAFPHLDWIPSDPDEAARDSVRAWTAEANDEEALPNLAEPLSLDASAPDWPLAIEDAERLRAILSINMIHIAPWRAALGLFAGAGRLLQPGGRLYLYGPFSMNGQHTATSNENFDASLRARDAEWGVRDVSDVAIAAASNELHQIDCVTMPINNFSLVFEKEA